MNGLGRFLGGARRALLELSGFSFVVNVLLLVMPLYMLQVYDRVLASGSSDTLLFLSIIAAAALVLLGLVEAVRGIYAARIGSRLEARMGRGALLAAIDGPRAPMGDVQVLRDMQQVRSFLAGRSIFALFDLPFAPLFILLLWFVHPALFVLTVVGAVILAVIAILNQRATARSNREAAEAGGAATLGAQSFVRSRESLAAMGMIDNVVASWGEAESKSLQAQDRASRTNSWLTGLSRTIRMGLQIAVLGYGAALVLRGEMTAGMIFASSIISGRALQPIDQVIGGWKQFVDVHASWQRLTEAVSRIEDETERTRQAEPKGRIDLENVVFAVQRPGEQPNLVIKRASARIQPGETIGVIGPSGAGKSTLLRLMVGALDPSNGTVRLDGADLRNWPAEQRGRAIGYLAQTIELLPGTVRQNIARFEPDATDEQVRLAAERAGVLELVNNLPAAFETRIGPGGHELSGGERQRIGLARAFYGMPRVLVLDEPNAALDEAGSNALERAIAEAKNEGSTVIIAAQRRDILRRVEKVMVIEDGQISAFDRVEAVASWLNERASQAGNVEPIRAGRAMPADRAPAGGTSAAPAVSAPAASKPSDPAPAVGETGPSRGSPSEAGAVPVRASFAPSLRVGQQGGDAQ